MKRIFHFSGIRDSWRDPDSRGLLAANVLVCLLALWEKDGLSFALVTFWWQNIILGLVNVLRILTVPVFVPQSGVRDQSSGSSRMAIPFEGRAILAGFFTVHYGFFHYGYYSFLHQAFRTAPWFWVAAAVAVFFGNELYLYWQDRGKGGAEKRIDRLMVAPYLRIIPMHGIIMAGMVTTLALRLLLGESSGDIVADKVLLVFFAVLKTQADLNMQRMERDPAWDPFRKPAAPVTPGLNR